MDKQKIKDKVSIFLEWNKKNWKAGGKDRWKVLGLWVVTLGVLVALLSNDEQQNTSDNESNTTETATATNKYKGGNYTEINQYAKENRWPFYSNVDVLTSYNKIADDDIKKYGGSFKTPSRVLDQRINKVARELGVQTVPTTDEKDQSAYACKKFISSKLATDGEWQFSKKRKGPLVTTKYALNGHPFKKGKNAILHVQGSFRRSTIKEEEKAHMNSLGISRKDWNAMAASASVTCVIEIEKSGSSTFAKVHEYSIVLGIGAEPVKIRVKGYTPSYAEWFELLKQYKLESYASLLPPVLEKVMAESLDETLAIKFRD